MPGCGRVIYISTLS